MRARRSPVYVNPDNPAEAMVDRDVRWAMAAVPGPLRRALRRRGRGRARGGVGATWFGGARRSGRSAARSPRMRASATARRSPCGTTPPRPRRHHVGRPATVGGLWIFTLIWNLISFPAAILVVPQIARDGEWLGLLVLLFPLIGVLVLWGAIAQTIALLRRGRRRSSLSRRRAAHGRALQRRDRASRAACKPGERFDVAPRRQRDGAQLATTASATRRAGRSDLKRARRGRPARRRCACRSSSTCPRA